MRQVFVGPLNFATLTSMLASVLFIIVCSLKTISYPVTMVEPLTPKCLHTYCCGIYAILSFTFYILDEHLILFLWSAQALPFHLSKCNTYQ